MTKKDTTDNLITQAERTKDEQREIARAGGIASGESRRTKAAMKKTLQTLLALPLENGEACDLEQIQSIAAMKGKNITVQEAIMFAQIKKAMKGDTRAAEFIRDSSGNKPVDALISVGDADNPLADLTTEELRRLLDG